ncbi:hypothetical protein KJ951_03285 [Patescibacteria group bacterium]|nr:hypothetical protein [Patescibacteria group bacterium]MBU1703402.1 hypothetical protein [Patescibacteria group bacterium]MBU1953735.1 hypothetical protein [Patescibacteria group bacterium]
MEIIPAIYLLDGKVVALYKGSTEQKETYYKSPAVFAENFQRAGALKLYVADLNAKFDHELAQKSEIKTIINAVKIPIMLEAAFSNVEAIKGALELGAAQVVLRSPSIEFAKTAIETFGPEKIIIQIFAKRTELIEKRQKKRSDDYTDIVDYAEKLVPLGVKYVMYKDQRAEGTLIHPNYDEIDRLFLTVGDKLKIYSSGGISEIKHLVLLKKIGAAGAIIGKALYERTITVEQAIAAVAD